MKTKLIPIGNSRGLRLPKPLIEEAGLEGEVDVSLRDGEIVIRPIKAPRSGWEEAAARLHERGGDGLVDDAMPTKFEETEWEW